MNRNTNKTTTNKIKEFGNSLTSSIKTTTNNIRNKTSNIINAAKSSISSNSNKKNQYMVPPIIAETSAKNVSNAVTNTTNNISKGTTTLVDSVGKWFGNVGKSASDMISSSAESHTSMSKFVFLIFVFIVFSIMTQIGIQFLAMLNSPSKNPIIVNGSRYTNQKKVYQVNPNVADPKPILRSINEDQGTEFSWSSWIWIDNVDYTSVDTPKRIFSKGESVSGNPYSMSSPGLFVFDNENKKADTNSITITLNTYTKGNSNDSIIEAITINNIPVQKWVNVIIRVQNRTVDVFINGVLTKRVELEKVIKQNNGDVIVGDQEQGMNGLISALRYFNHAVGPSEIQDIMFKGPLLKLEDSNKQAQTTSNYLSSRWFYNSV